MNTLSIRRVSEHAFPATRVNENKILTGLPRSTLPRPRLVVVDAAKVVGVSLLYSGGIPVLYLFASFSFAINFIIDKVRRERMKWTTNALFGVFFLLIGRFAGCPVFWSTSFPPATLINRANEYLTRKAVKIKNTTLSTCQYTLVAATAGIKAVTNAGGPTPSLAQCGRNIIRLDTLNDVAHHTTRRTDLRGCRHLLGFATYADVSARICLRTLLCKGVRAGVPGDL